MTSESLRVDGGIPIEGITEQNGLKEIFEHDPFNHAVSLPARTRPDGHTRHPASTRKRIDGVIQIEGIAEQNGLKKYSHTPPLIPSYGCAPNSWIRFLIAGSQPLPAPTRFSHWNISNSLGFSVFLILNL